MASRRPNTRSNPSIESSSPTCSPVLTRKTLINDSTVKQDFKKKQDPKSKNNIVTENLSENITDDDSSDNTSPPKDYTTKNTDAVPESLTLTESPLVSTRNWSAIFYVSVGIVLLAIAIAIPFFFLDPNLNNVEKQEDPSYQRIKFLEEMQHSFPKQPRNTWVTFFSALTSVMDEEEPSQPAVILLVGENTAESIHTMQCVAKQLAEVTNKLFSMKKSTNSHSTEFTVQVDLLDHLLQKREEIVKEELENRIRIILDKSHSIVFGHLENLPPRVAVLLHGYCDNFMAPFKDRVFILTATFDSDNRPVDSDQVDKRLHGLWDSNLGRDISASLVSRVANNPVFIVPENGSVPCL